MPLDPFRPPPRHRITITIPHDDAPTRQLLAPADTENPPQPMAPPARFVSKRKQQADAAAALWVQGGTDGAGVVWSDCREAESQSVADKMDLLDSMIGGGWERAQRPPPNRI